MNLIERSIPSHADCLALIDEVERRFEVPEGAARDRSRKPEWVAPRHAAFWALSRAGLNRVEIARLFARNHSTVVHGLARAELRPDWQLLVAPAVELAGADGVKPALHRWLERGLARQDAADRTAVEAYITCTVLGWERHPGTVCGYGLLLVARQARIHAAVDMALQRCGLARHIPRIELQAARFGRSG